MRLIYNLLYFLFEHQPENRFIPTIGVGATRGQSYPLTLFPKYLYLNFLRIENTSASIATLMLTSLVTLVSKNKAP